MVVHVQMEVQIHEKSVMMDELTDHVHQITIASVPTVTIAVYLHELSTDELVEMEQQT